MIHNGNNCEDGLSIYVCWFLIKEVHVHLAVQLQEF